MAFKKIDREFCLTDNSVNCYGYRLLTEGLELERFKPSIGYLMHDRSKGVAVKWEDFRVDGDRLYAKPLINSSTHPSLADEIENGFYSAASVGHIIALEYSDDAALKLDGQTGITVTKWFCRECSIVDIPGNFNALAKLYDERDAVLADLTDNKQSNFYNTQKMEKKPELTSAMLSGLSLAEAATQGQADTAFADLLARAKRTETLEKEIAELKAAQSKEAVANIIATGKKNGKLTIELAAKLETDYAGNPAGLKALVDTMPAQNRVTGKADELAGVPEKYRGKTKEELYVSGLLEPLKSECPEYFNQIMKGE